MCEGKVSEVNYSLGARLVALFNTQLFLSQKQLSSFHGNSFFIFKLALPIRKETKCANFLISHAVPCNYSPPCAALNITGILNMTWTFTANLLGVFSPLYSYLSISGMEMGRGVHWDFTLSSVLFFSLLFDRRNAFNWALSIESAHQKHLFLFFFH